MNTKEDRSGLLTNDDYIDLDFTSEAEDDSLEDISHMQENSLTSCCQILIPVSYFTIALLS